MKRQRLKKKRAVQYGYDNLYRLTGETISGAASQNGAIAYVYDAVGNRLSMSSTVLAVPAGSFFYDANDRLQTDQYDANGNTVGSGGIGNSYDFENHLIQHGNVVIVYDGDGNRVRETVGGVTTSYLVADVNPTGYVQVLDELQNGAVTRAYIYGLERISQRPTTNGQGPSYYGYDGHGSVRFLTNASGSVTDTYTYDAFGNLITQTGSTANNYLFAGEQFDPALGLYYNRARYLDVRTGRFWGIDPLLGSLQEPWSLHRYLYAANNPANRVDPSGQESLLETVNNFAIDLTIKAQSVLQAYPVATSIAQSLFAAGNLYLFYTDEDFRNQLLALGPQFLGEAMVADISALVSGGRGLYSWVARSGALFEDADFVISGGLAAVRARPSVPLAGTSNETVSVYRVFDEEGNVIYVGITNNIRRRGIEQLAERGYVIYPIPGLGNLTREQARNVEQALIEEYGFAASGGTLENQINSISPRRPEYLDRVGNGCEILAAAGIQVTTCH